MCGDAYLREPAHALEPRDALLDDAQLRLRRQARDRVGEAGREHAGQRRRTQAGDRRGEQRLLRLDRGRELHDERLGRSADLLQDITDPRAQAFERRPMHAVVALDEVAELGAERLGGAAAEPDQRAGLDGGGEPRPRRELREDLIDRGVGRRDEQDALVLCEQLLDDVRERDGLAGPGWTPDQREVAVAAELDRGELARVEPGMIAAQRRGGACVRLLAEQAQRDRDRVTFDVELVERLQ